MTVSAKIDLLRQHPAFQGCAKATFEKLSANSEVVHFGIGQALSASTLIPERVRLITIGKARLLGQHNGQLNTLALLGPGNLIGLASLLRAEGCEEVSASTDLEALTLPDELIAEIYGEEISFRNWCNSNVFPAELASLLQNLLSQSERSPYGILDVLRQALPQAQSFIGSAEALSEIDADQQIFVASANTTASLNSNFEKADELPASQGLFGLRLLTLPQITVDKITAGKDQAKPGAESETVAVAAENSVPAQLHGRSSLDLTGQDPRDCIDLISAEGPLGESLACFRMLAQVMGLPYRRDSMEKKIRETLRRGKQPSMALMGQLAAGMGLHASGGKIPPALCTRMNVPCLMSWSDGFGVVVRSDANGLLMAHPRLGWLELSPAKIAETVPNGIQVILVDRTSATPDAKFNFSWFFPAIQRYRSTLLLVLGSSFVVQLFTLANPLLIQVIIDKVIAQRSLDTLQVLGIALVAVTIFEGLLGSLRTFMFADTTNRIDMRLGAEVIDHLLRLPVGYFDRRPVGELGTRVAELEKIRNFLTGEALTTVIDATFSVIYIAVMAIYSWALTLIALVVVPIQVVITLVGAPLFRRQFRQAAEENARTQSHLVEVLTGIQTVKSQNVEMVSRWKWQERYAKYIDRSYEKTITATALNQTGQVFQKLSQLMVLWVGASLVLNGQLTLGQLIAFRIISGYVTQPLLRLSTIWQRIQELRVSFERLADIVDTAEESTELDQNKIPLPPIRGDVSFQDLKFQFGPDKPQVLKNINLEIPAGTFVGVVGQSGSGKSTLMKLMPRLYSPNVGRILIDGYDIDKVELYSLRRQIGIVPQDPLLFSGSVSDNIALTDPSASAEEIANAAQIACAHEFIMGLSSGYSTELGERGAASPVASANVSYRSHSPNQSQNVGYG